MSGDRKIVLHIGLHKTGTSTIQNVLHANRELLLEEEGVLYPSLAANLSIPLSTIFKDNPQKPMTDPMAGLTTEEVEAPRRKDYLGSLETEISSREWSTLMLSAEVISHFWESEMARLRDWAEKYSSEWTILVCVRHPIDWTRSVVQERLKQGETLQQLYEKPPAPKYQAKISNAISVFGRENVRIFDFDAAARSEGGVVGTFAQKAGLTAPSRDLLTSRAVNANESLSSEAVRILDSLNRQRPIFVDGVRAPRRAGPGHELPYLRRIKGRKFDLPESVKENILLNSREDVGWLNETFGLDLYRDVADFAPRTEGREEPVEALSDPAIDTIAGVFGELVTENVFHRALEGGRVALERGNLDRAEKMLRKAARLDPDAQQPQKLLERVSAKQSSERATDAQQGGSGHNFEGKKSGKRRGLLRRLPPRVRGALARLKRKAGRTVWTK